MPNLEVANTNVPNLNTGIRKLATDSKPTAVCAWGRDNRIEAESDSSLLGFDFLTLGTMLHGGNNPRFVNVKE